VSVSVSLGGS